MMLGGWGRSPGSSGSVPPSGQRTGHRLLPLPFNRSGSGNGSGGGGGRAAEAEDVMGHYGRNKGGVNKIRTGLYYSPPGTSYTILEKPPVSSPPPPPPRATYLRESSAGVQPVSNHGQSHGPNHGPSHGPNHGPGHGPNHGPNHGPSHGPNHGPSHGPNHGPSHGPNHDPGHGPNHGPSHGPNHGPSHGPNHGPNHGANHGPVHGHNHPGTGSNNSRPNSASARGSAGKKRPISPEQVLKMFAAPNFSASSSYHVPNAKPQSPPTHGSNTTQSHHKSSSAIHNDNLTVRTISMSRPNVTSGSPSSQGFGICVKGGADESNVGVYISRVEEGSIAESVGLKPGDSILEVNGRPFSSVSHEEALKIFKSYRQITMTVKSPSPPQSMPTMHKKDNGENTNQDDAWGLSRTYSWINRKGQPVSPPLEYSKPISPYSKWSYTRSSKDKIRKVELMIEPGQSLGLMIRGGTEYNLGIFITGIDKDSVADRSGLMIGDQILEVNGQSFLNLSHDEAVNQLKFQKQMTLTVRDVGKVPHSCTTYSPDTWNHSLDNADGVLKLGTSAASQMVEEKARILLTKNEFNTLRYYLDEYSCSRMSIDAFIGILFELLNTTDKFTLLTELRELIGPSDRDRFDQLVYRRGRESRKTHSRNLDGFNPNLPCGQSKEFTFPNENSGMDVGTPEYSNSNYRPSSDGKHSPIKTNEQCHRDMEVEEFEYSHQDYGDLETELLPRKYHNDLVDVGYAHRNSDLYDESNMTRSSQLSNKHGRSYDGKNELLDEDGSYRRESGFIEPSCSNSQNESQIMLDQQGNLRIIVKKIKPLLGIAIEGGINTKHLLPRIINIHENGAAYEAGGLEVGQLILEVDGQKVEGMPHQEVARLIAESFAQTDKSEIEFLVVEAKKSNLEPKPTALIFMES